LLLGFAPAYALYRCTLDGGVRRECCCRASPETPRSAPAFQDRDCCEVQAIRATATPAAPGNDPAHLLVAPCAVVRTSVAIVPSRAKIDARMGGWIRAIGPPPLERKQALLI